MQNLVNALVENEAFSIRVFYLDKKVDTNVAMSVPAEQLNPGKFRFTDFDIIHTNGIRPDLFAFWNRRKIKYHISTIHNFVFEDLTFTYNEIISFLFGNIWLILWKKADKLICVSNSLKNYYSKWFSTEKLEVIYNGISETDDCILSENDVIKSINDFRSKGLTIIGSAGILTKRKGIEQVLQLISIDRTLGALIIGDGRELSNLIHLSERLNITERCKFCGFLNNAQEYFRYFDFFIMPSRSEGFGLTLMEAVRQKIPVICSDIEVFKELLSEEEATFFKSGDLPTLISALQIAKETGISKTDFAYTRYLNNYTLGLMAKHYSEVYEAATC
jgi:glycosyltransferase involved in cell wall biosynthesis